MRTADDSRLAETAARQEQRALGVPDSVAPSAGSGSAAAGEGVSANTIANTGNGTASPRVGSTAGVGSG